MNSLCLIAEYQAYGVISCELPDKLKAMGLHWHSMAGTIGSHSELPCPEGLVDTGTLPRVEEAGYAEQHGGLDGTTVRHNMFTVQTWPERTCACNVLPEKIPQL